MDVREAMTPRPVTVAPETSIAAALTLMRRGRFRHLPVVAGDRLAGVVTERDLHAGEDGIQPERGNRPVRTVMTAAAITVAPDDPVEQAARVMLENKVGCLPVLEGETLAGIITESDIFRAFVQVLGVMEPGTRVQIRAPSLVYALERIAGVAQAEGIRVISVVSETPRPGAPASLVVRFGTLMLASLLGALRAAGLEVDEPDAGSPDAGRAGSAV